MTLTMISFQESIWLWFTPLILGVILYLYWFGYHKKQRTLKVLLNPELLEPFTRQVAAKRRILKRVLFSTALVAVVIAIARPQWGYFWEETPQETIDILFALDTSRSMLAPDLKPNRLFRAKLAIEDLARQLEGVRLGLIPFAGDALVWCPLTYDIDAFLDTLRTTDTELIPTGGTDLLSAVTTADRAFTNETNVTRIMILLTDGEDLTGQLESLLPEVAEKGWTIHTVGIGTQDGELIPITREDGSTSFVTDEEGNVIKSALDESTLQLIAERTGGSYQWLGTTGEGLRTLFDERISQDLQIQENSRLRKIPIERYYWLVAIALVLLIIEPIISDRRRKMNSSKNTGSLTMISLFSTVCVLFPENQLEANARKAEKAFIEQSYETAQGLYQQDFADKPDRFESAYNAGVSAIEMSDFATAKESLESALNTNDIPLQASTLYNLGNVGYELGMQSLDINPQQTVTAWENALKHYQTAIALDPENEDARINHDEVKRLLDKLKELLDQQQQQNQDQNEDSQNQDQQQSQDQQNQDQNGENQESEQQRQQGDQSQENQDQQQGEQPEPEPQNGEEDSQDQDQSQQPDETDQQSEESQQEQPEQQPGEQQPQPTPTQAGNEQDEEAREQALLLLESLENEDGDFEDVLLRLRPQTEDQEPEKDW